MRILISDNKIIQIHLEKTSALSSGRLIAAVLTAAAMGLLSVEGPV